MIGDKRLTIMDDRCPFCKVKFKNHKQKKCKDIAFIYYKCLELIQ